DVARFFQAAAKRVLESCLRVGRATAEVADDRLISLLRVRRERPCNSRAAEKRDELAAFHSITSSASRRKESRTVRPSAFAAIILTISSNLIGDCTGRSAGFSPRKMRSTYEAVRRKMSDGSGPYETRLPSKTNCL